MRLATNTLVRLRGRTLARFSLIVACALLSLLCCWATWRGTKRSPPSDPDAALPSVPTSRLPATASAGARSTAADSGSASASESLPEIEEAEANQGDEPSKRASADPGPAAPEGGDEIAAGHPDREPLSDQEEYSLLLEQIRDFQLDQRERGTEAEEIFSRYESLRDRQSKGEELAFSSIRICFENWVKFGSQPGDLPENARGTFLRQLYSGAWKEAWKSEFERGWIALVETVSEASLQEDQSAAIVEAVWRSYDEGRAASAEIERVVIDPDQEFGDSSWKEAWDLQVEAHQPLCDQLFHDISAVLTEEQRAGFEDFLEICQLGTCQRL